MMKKVIEKLIKVRNPNFQFDPNLSDGMMFQFFISTLGKLIRGTKTIFYLKRSKGAMFDKGVSLRHSQNIKWGKFIKLGKFVQLNGLGTNGIILGNGVSIGDFSKAVVSTSLNNIGDYISLGDNVGIGEYAYLGGAGGLTIGKACIIGQYFSTHPENHNFDDKNIEIRSQGVTRLGISIGADCWIGSKVIVLDGVSIGAHSVVAAGAVVNKSFPPYSVIGGVPAKLIKSRTSHSSILPKIINI